MGFYEEQLAKGVFTQKQYEYLKKYAPEKQAGGRAPSGGKPGLKPKEELPPAMETKTYYVYRNPKGAVLTFTTKPANWNRMIGQKNVYNVQQSVSPSRTERDLIVSALADEMRGKGKASDILKRNVERVQSRAGSIFRPGVPIKEQIKNLSKADLKYVASLGGVAGNQAQKLLEAKDRVVASVKAKFEFVPSGIEKAKGYKASIQETVSGLMPVSKEKPYKPPPSITKSFTAKQIKEKRDLEFKDTFQLLRDVEPTPTLIPGVYISKTFGISRAIEKAIEPAIMGGAKALKGAGVTLSEGGKGFVTGAAGSLAAPVEFGEFAVRGVTQPGVVIQSAWESVQTEKGLGKFIGGAVGSFAVLGATKPTFPYLPKFAKADIKIPTVSGEVSTVAYGFKLGAKRGVSIVYKTADEIGFGSPKYKVATQLEALKPGLTDIKIGGELETVIMRGALDVSKQALPRAKVAPGVGQAIIGKTVGVKSKFKAGLPKETAKLEKGEVDILIGVAKEEQLGLFGSGARVTQLREGTILPRDLDFRMLKATTNVDVVIGKSVGRLTAYGSKVRPSPEIPGAIEKFIKGKWEKVAEIKGKGVIEQEIVPEKVLGYQKEGKPTKVEGLDVTRLDEELRGVMQGVMRVRKTPEGLDILPPPKRMKDIGAVKVTGEALLESKWLFKKGLEKELLKFEKLYPEKAGFVKPADVKIKTPLYKPPVREPPSPISVSAISKVAKVPTPISDVSISKISPGRSISASISASIFKSSSISTSISKSLSPSVSKSVSVSVSPMKSLSASITASLSPSISPPSRSASTSASVSRSISASISGSSSSMSTKSPYFSFMSSDEVTRVTKKKKKPSKGIKVDVLYKPSLLGVEIGKIVKDVSKTQTGLGIRYMKDIKVKVPKIKF